MQQLAWLTFIHSDTTATQHDVDEAKRDILAQNSPLFMREVEQLSLYQMDFLRAIVDGVWKEFSQREVVERYHLGSSATVATVKKTLKDKEIIDITGSEVSFLDPVFQLWFKKNM